jgi:hypothetical protein
MANTKTTNKGVSLAKGPAGIIGIILLAFGVGALLFGSRSFTTHFIHGTEPARLRGQWLERPALRRHRRRADLRGPLRWGAKTVSLIVGIILGEAALFAFVDGHDAFGIFRGQPPPRAGLGHRRRCLARRRAPAPRGRRQGR